MSRQSTAPAGARQLTLTEELEKLEQSITLTLQEIDHNFSRAHRIVTASILPVVEQYAEHSRNVWEGSKFWKQFFEASANVSLSGYEEPPSELEDDEDEETQAECDEETVTLSTSADATTDADADAETPSSYSSVPHANAAATPPSQRHASPPTNTLPSPDYSTPRPQRVAAYNSPYEALRREVQGQRSGPPSSAASTVSSTLPSTPRAQTTLPATATPTTAQHRTPGPGPSQDPLLHRVLDRNYRVQATPHAPASQVRLPKAKTPGKTPRTDRTVRTPGTQRQGHTARLDLDSSPLEEAPRLQTDLFRNGSPAKRVPGVSVLATPGGAGTRRKSGGAAEDKGGEASRYLEFSDDEDDDFNGLPEGMSPPKTMQFHIPQSKLLKTPAREASRQIVADLLYTAGGTGDDEDILTEDGDASPSVVQVPHHAGALDESF